MFKKTTHIHYVIFILAIIAVLFVLLFLRSRVHVSTESTALPAISANTQFNQTLIAGNLSIPVSIADTEAARDQGLSDTASLPANDGKLFVFQNTGTPGFWMKDMNYGLDFIWIDSSMKIVAITSNVAANTYPEIFYPPQPILYTLEVNAGFSTQHGLKVGQQLTLEQ